MTTLEELLAMMSADEKKGARPDPVAEAAVDDACDDPDSLDDGPVLTGRLWPSALPRPEARKATSGLIDVRAMAAAYREATAEPVPTRPPLLAPAEGAQPVVIVESPTGPATRARRRSRLARAWRGAALFALGGMAFALVALVDRRTAPPVAAETSPLAVGPSPVPLAAASPAIPREPPLEMVVIDLPTTITEVSEPAEQPEPAPAEEPAPSAMMLARDTRPIRPSNSEIANAMVAAQDDLERCREAFGTGGLVPIEIEVTPDGTITSVAVGLGATGFRDCIQGSLRRQRLPASKLGTTAKFSIVVR